MTDSNSHTWLSAFLDGEMTADERAAADVRLREDAAARQQLELFREVGELLRSLPGSEPPAGFATIVMQRCERESLLAGPIPAGAAATAAPRVSRSAIAIGVSLLATAAMIFVLVQVVSPQGAPTQKAAEGPASLANDDRTRSEPDAGKALAKDTAEKTSADRLPMTGAAPAGAAPEPQNATKSAAPSVTRSNATPKHAITANQNDHAPFSLHAGGRGGLGGGSAAALEFGNRQSGIRIGEVVPYLQVSGDRTAVIEVTVVDVNRAVGRLEVLLERKLVQPLTNEPRQQGLLKKGAGKLLSLGPSADKKAKTELIAVYVESTQAQLAQVMSELDRETQSLHVSLRPPVALGDVRVRPDSDVWADLFHRDRRRMPQTLADAAAFGRQVVIAKSARKADGTPGGTKRPAPPSVPKDDAKDAKRNDSRGKPSAQKNGSKQRAAAGFAAGTKPADPAADAGADAATASRSFQLRVKLSDQPAARDEQDRNGRKGRFGGSVSAARQPVRRSLGAGASREPGASPPVQVIFVFRAKSPSEQPVPARRPSR
jgi:negative regulator of sigma E activity